MYFDCIFSSLAERPQLDGLVFSNSNKEMTFGQPPNPTDIFRMPSIIGHQSWFSNLIDLPQLNNFIFACGCNPRMPVFPTQNDLAVPFKKEMKVVCQSVHDLCVSTVGDHEEIV
jgi:hypothetical protein